MGGMTSYTCLFVRSAATVKSFAAIPVHINLMHILWGWYFRMNKSFRIVVVPKYDLLPFCQLDWLSMVK